MKSHVAAICSSPLSPTIHSDAPPTETPGFTVGPGIGPIPRSSDPNPWMAPALSTLSTGPSPADV